MGVHGVDALKKVCRAVVLNEGELVDEFSFRNSKRGIEDFMMKIEVFKDKAPRRVFPFPIFSFCCSTVFWSSLGIFLILLFRLFYASLNSAVSRALLSLKSAKTERTKLRDLSTLTKFQTQNKIPNEK